MLNRPFKVVLSKDGVDYAASSFDTLREANETADTAIAAFKDASSEISVSIYFRDEIQALWRRVNE